MRSWRSSRCSLSEIMNNRVKKLREESETVLSSTFYRIKFHKNPLEIYPTRVYNPYMKWGERNGRNKRVLLSYK